MVVREPCLHTSEASVGASEECRHRAWPWAAVPRWQLIVKGLKEEPRGGTCVKGMVCGSICESLKLASQVHLAALGCDPPHCLLTGKSVWTPNTSMKFFLPQCSVSLGTLILVIKFFCELGNVRLVFLHSVWYTVSIQ